MKITKSMKQTGIGILIGGMIVIGGYQLHETYRSLDYDFYSTYSVESNTHTVKFSTQGNDKYIERCADEIAAQFKQANLGKVNIIHISEDGQWTLFYFESIKA